MLFASHIRKAATVLLLVCAESHAMQQPTDLARDIAPSLRGALLHEDDFKHGLSNWKLEVERPGLIVAQDGLLDIDVPAGATLWFKPKLSGPVLIEYDAKAVADGGANDRVSDLNSFWMATDPQHPSDIFLAERHGAFAEYNSLLTYYAGLGGNGNTTTRFRRYIGSPAERPLLPENDLSAPQFLLQPNKVQRISLLADGNTIAVYRDGQRLFLFQDSEPYTQGWFALRTTKSHIQVSRLRIYKLSGPVAAHKE